MGTRLHRKRGEEGTYVAIAEWESIEARQQAMAEIKKGETSRAQRVKEWRNNEDFGEVTVIGELDEIDNVLPDPLISGN